MRELFACGSGLHLRVVCIRELFVYESCLEESCLHGRAVCMGEQYVILARLGGRALMRTSRRQAGGKQAAMQVSHELMQMIVKFAIVKFVIVRFATVEFATAKFATAKFATPILQKHLINSNILLVLPIMLL